MENKYHYDLKNVHYARGTKNEDGTITFGVPERIPGSVGMEITPEGETLKKRADGIDYIVTNSNNGYNGKLTLIQIPDLFKTHCLGEKVDEVTGIQYEDSNVEFEPFALMFEFVGDVKNKRHVLYNNTAKRSAIKGENKENQKEPDTEELEFTTSPMKVYIDGKETSIVKANSTFDTKPDVYDSWYKETMIPGKEPSKEQEPSPVSLYDDESVGK